MKWSYTIIATCIRNLYYDLHWIDRTHSVISLIQSFCCTPHCFLLLPVLLTFSYSVLLFS
ncbi:hypothetical protein CW304_16390 [Bacillus sp. UFRGS-B20]|nr:hypothetical protein CW304_16390 [Bacillus sp. UFRGS-B20]